ncbi:hypothetical protein OsI_03944 [Oryza sativa Indica Group]|uniref:Uncharacterized protein n=1 Tax=Oryza sativa subsp. indica TaxID=39946 RepID=B8AA79_ORYSI|nr:hypothetical protein OsI_03944 [Oryza sativa Indica Group]
MTFLNVHEVLPNHVMKYLSGSKVVAVGRDISGKLITTDGMLISDSNGSEDTEEFMLSTCKISEAGIGGPLIDFDGRYVGINFFDDIVGTPFLSCTVILHVLSRFDEERTINKVGNGDTSSGVLDWTMTGDRSVRPNSWPVPKPFWCHPDDLPRNETRTRHKYGYYNGQKFKFCFVENLLLNLYKKSYAWFCHFELLCLCLGKGI